MPSSKTSSKKNQQPESETVDDNSDGEQFYSSEEEEYESDDYQSNNDSDYDSQYDSDEYQSGGDSDDDRTDDELDSDSANIDTDPDDEADPNEDDKYDPIDENEELEDPDKENENEDDNDADNEGENEEVDEEVEGDEIINDDAEFTAETKNCHLKNLNKDFIVLDEDDSNLYAKMEYTKIEDEDRDTDNVMTYYEMVRIIGTRAQQFNFAAPALVEGVDDLPPAKRAYVELISKQTPYIIRRHLPGKKYEDWKIGELEIIHTIDDEFFVPENFDWDALMANTEKVSQMARTSNKKSRSKSKTSSKK